MAGDVTGDLFEKTAEVNGEWRISNFLSLPEEVDRVYISPKFFFMDSCWCISIYPSGQTSNHSEGWIGLFLSRLNGYSQVTVSYSFSFLVASIEERIDDECRTFTNETNGWGCAKLLKRSALQRGEKVISPSEALTISYTVKSSDRQPLESTLCNRLWSMSITWNNILAKKERTDVVLKLKDGKISAHRVILESSSAVFRRMFDVDMQESQTGEVNIEDATADEFRVALSYIYSGEPKGLGCVNACEVYKIAHKYELKELREFCAKFMRKTLCMDTVYDVIALADLYQETALMERAKNYMAKNKTDIFKSDKWKTFKRDNPTIACQVLECVLEDV